MRIARKLMLLAVVAVAAMAFTASSASAVGVNDEASGEPCSAVSNTHHGDGTGGCQIHATSVTPIELATSLGMILCDNEFEARVDGAGEGYIYGQTLTNCQGGTVVPCAESGVVDNWVVHLNAEDSMEATFCVTAFGFINVTCHLPSVTVAQAAHDDVTFSVSHTQKCEGSSTQSVEGTWVAEVDDNHPPLEIVD
jgi:hypothetical protein